VQRQQVPAEQEAEVEFVSGAAQCQDNRRGHCSETPPATFALPVGALELAEADADAASGNNMPKERSGSVGPQRPECIQLLRKATQAKQHQNGCHEEFGARPMAQRLRHGSFRKWSRQPQVVRSLPAPAWPPATA